MKIKEALKSLAKLWLPCIVTVGICYVLFSIMSPMLLGITSCLLAVILSIIVVKQSMDEDDNK
jgi:hypothetical protein